MLYDHKKVERLKERYPAGTRIKLINMSCESDMPSGLMGTVDLVDDIGQIQMTWDNGRSLALVPSEDSFTIITQPGQMQHQGSDAQLNGEDANITKIDQPDLAGIEAEAFKLKME